MSVPERVPMQRMQPIAFLIVALILAASGASRTTPVAGKETVTITVSAASDLTGAFEEIGDAFESDSNRNPACKSTSISARRDS
jgi:ABC-type molybdate transport system substrate-binding protein